MKKGLKNLNVRLPEHLYQTLKDLAEEDDTTMSEYVKRMIKEKSKK